MVVSGTPATNVEVVPRDTGLSSGYGLDSDGGRTADDIVYLTKRFGPISSFSGSYRANKWTVNIEHLHMHWVTMLIKCADMSSSSFFIFTVCGNSSTESPQCKEHIVHTIGHC